MVRSAGFLPRCRTWDAPGFRQSGVSLGGALDSHALRVANALVGNRRLSRGSRGHAWDDCDCALRMQRVVAWCGGAFTVRIGERESSGRSRGSGREGRRADHDRAANRARGPGWRFPAGSMCHRFSAAVPPICAETLAATRDAPCGSAMRCRSGTRRFKSADCRENALRISEWSAPATWATTRTRDRHPALRARNGLGPFHCATRTPRWS